ncbi:TolC family protein [Galbibacter sp. EGI 63066]|uniref:TolC family protein n=1 Tax=Galbibacter sp. EGI 63066 TaxID=2993559 RepID=UPI0022497E67|nr:TolC family protein [Galbibacter sp. EGI 63066]MCX2681785.1 TolC family protein [Galbibacter sp. EGI 63066]
MKLILLVVTLLCSVFLSAQTQYWTLEECVRYAEENNLTIQQAELDLENAKIDKSDAIGNFIPTINGQVSATSSTGANIDPLTNSLINQTVFSMSPSISSSVTLFDGLRNFHRLNRANLSAVATQYQVEDIKDDIRLAVANAYLQILSNRETLNVLKAQYKATQQDLERTRELVDNGVLPRGDLLEIEATAANQEQQIVNAENSVIISRIGLAQLLQITDYENFDVVDEGYVIPDDSVLEVAPKEIYEKAVSFRNDIKASEMNVELAEKDLDIAKGARYPSLGAFFNYNTRYSDGNTASFTDQLWFFDGFSYGVQLNIPILNNFSVKNNIKRSKIGVNRAELQLQQDKLNLETDVNQAFADVKGAFKSYEAAGKAIEARRLAFDYAKERYNVGLMNGFDFSQAQARLDDAEATLIQTKYNYIFRLKVLQFYYGIPLEQW